MEELDFTPPMAEVYTLPISDIDIYSLAAHVGKELGLEVTHRPYVAVAEPEDEDAELPDLTQLEPSGAIFKVDDQSTTGILIETDGDDLRLSIPPLAYIGDIAFACAFLRLAGVNVPDDKEYFLWEKSQDTIRRYVEMKNVVFVISGAACNYRIVVDWIKDFYPEADTTAKLANVAMENFRRLQHDFWKLHQFASATVTKRDNPSESVHAMVLSPRTGIAWQAEKFLLAVKEGTKIVDPGKFLKAMKGNKHFFQYDVNVFSLTEMPADEWEQICQEIPGDMLTQPRTFLLRWNPSISSYTLERYRENLKQYGKDFCMDWSVWQWEDARKGDLFYMLREGDGINSGIVFRGVFVSDPYEGDDWAGGDRKRRYVNLECYDCADPDAAPKITTEQLDDAMPEYNWHKGHSGELLPTNIASYLNQLWEENNPSNSEKENED